MVGTDNDSGSGTDRTGRQRSTNAGNQAKSEFQASVDRLEAAVQELVGSATSEFSDRASTLVDDITRKIQSEFRSAKSSGGRSRSDSWRVELGLTDEDLGLDDDDLYDDSMDYAGDDYDGSSGHPRDRRSSAERMRARRHARRRQLQQTRVRSSRLYRDPEHAKIGGVCAGLANYYGMETWVVRCIAVTGLLFLGQIVFPAYWIAYFVMDTPQKAQQRRQPDSRRRRDRIVTRTPREVPPGQTLRNVELDLNQAELRLRRMESHVTSGHYELQKELNRIDPESPVNGGNHQAEGAK
jgi:phage shock protein C